MDTGSVSSYAMQRLRKDSRCLLLKPRDCQHAERTHFANTTCFADSNCPLHSLPSLEWRPKTTKKRPQRKLVPLFIPGDLNPRWIFRSTRIKATLHLHKWTEMKQAKLLSIPGHEMLLTMNFPPRLFIYVPEWIIRFLLHTAFDSSPWAIDRLQHVSMLRSLKQNDDHSQWNIPRLSLSLYSPPVKYHWYSYFHGN